jgi:aryl-alcohol dehydrogenase-like predicted oxidoreductase
MKYRMLGKTNFLVSEVSLGTWQLGGKWGSKFDEKLAFEVLSKAVENGINFFDTADVYSNGLSEKAIGKFLKQCSKRIYVATKCGRRLNPHLASGYTPDSLRKFIEDSLRNLQVDTIDLIQLHCPPTEVYYKPEIFEFFDKLKQEGKILNLGVSVEKVEEAIKAIEYPNVCTVQIIFNIFRQRPSELFFKLAKQKNVGIIVRVPLASGLLTGKFTLETEFSNGDHRKGNRNGEWFDRGETFAGVDYEKGLTAVEELKKIFSAEKPLSVWAIKWILMFDEVSTVIPGASRPEQVETNVMASDVRDLTEEEMAKVKEVYEKNIKPDVHQRW